MRFLLLSKADILGCLNLNRLLPMLLPRHEARVFLSDHFQPCERDNPLAARFTRSLRDYPMEEFFPALDAKERRAKEWNPACLTFGGLSRRYSVPVTLCGPDQGRAMELLDAETRAAPPDVIFCCRHDFILPERIYSRAAHGAYNTHSGKLPEYRGPFCSFWAMLNREAELACSLHTLKPRVDAGDVIALGTTPADYNASLLANMAAIYRAGLDAFERLLPDLEKGPLAGTPQNSALGRYYPEPAAADRERFIAAGGVFVNDEEYRTLLGNFLPPDDGQ